MKTGFSSEGGKIRLRRFQPVSLRGDTKILRTGYGGNPGFGQRSLGIVFEIFYTFYTMQVRDLGVSDA